MNIGASSLSTSIVLAFPGKAYGVKQSAIVVRLTGPEAVNSEVERAFAQCFEPALPKSSAPAPASSGMALAVVYWTVALQQAAGLAVFEPGRLLRTRSAAPGTSLSTVLIPCAPGRALGAQRALEWVTRWLGSPGDEGLGGLAESADAQVRSLRAFAPSGKNTIHQLRAAHEADIPWDWITGNCYQYGWGARSRLMESTFTDRTPVLGATLARQKHLAAAILRRAGLPAPRHALAKDSEDAIRIAAKLGYPVVVKPANLDGGVGVAAGLRDEASVRRAFVIAARLSKLVLVEKHFQGQDYRLLVFNGQHFSTALRQPGGVTGNGVETVEQLVLRVNLDPRRSAEGLALKTLVLDDEAMELLAEQQMSAASVPASGDFTRLRRAANVAMGGISIAVHDQVHPDNARLAEQAAKAFGLDLAGIDLLIPDIAQSWLETGALICEVNGQPQFGTRSQTLRHGEILRALVPHGGRIPTVVTVGRDNTDIHQALRRRLGARGWRVGLATSDGAYLDGLPQGRPNGVFNSAQALLFNKEVDVLIVDVSDGVVLRTGLPMDMHDVLVLASGVGAIGSNVLGQLMSLLAPHHRMAVVINVDDPACAAAVPPSTRNARRVGTAQGVVPADAQSDPLPELLAAAVIDCLAPTDD